MEIGFIIGGPGGLSKYLNHSYALEGFPVVVK